MRHTIYTHHYKVKVSTPLYKEYKLISTKLGQSLTDNIQIKTDDVMEADSPEYWLYYSINRKWSKKALTPLYNTKLPNVYIGWLKPNKDTFLFRFNGNDLTVFYYPNVYAFDNRTKLKQLLSELPV